MPQDGDMQSHDQIHKPPQLPQDKQKPPKELRFITSHGAPHPKRRRVNAACRTCRKRKVACSGERPGCNTCSQNKVECGGYDGGSQSRSSTAASKPPSTNSRVQQEIKPEEALRHSFSASSEAPPGSNTITRRQSNLVAGSEASIERQTGAPAEPKEERADDGSGPTLFSGPRNRMPYFRWLGPTAIMPGFKQMVVKIKRQDTINGVSSNHSTDGAGAMGSPNMQRNASVLSTTPLPMETDMRTPLTLPFYDTSSMPPSELITHLCNTFFTHLGCNFPFLQRGRFLKDLEEKQVDAILVDAVCAMAARFSTHPLLTQQGSDGEKTIPSEHGSAFAQRAKEALTHTFATPNVAAVQAALLLAYNEFGESRDSGLWMYLGISIRLAQDLGLQKLDGLCYEGRDGPTPKMVKRNEGAAHMQAEEKRIREAKLTPVDEQDAENQRAVERERIDTFWSVFFLDRVVSSGTGRRSTLRDKDIELSFPSLDSTDSNSGWPFPFPALIRIIHLYGRVADLLNGIKEPLDITEDTSRRLANMEATVTNFYQGLSPKLHFQAMNFHHYVKAGEGTNFVLLHFWFHTLIVLLHQPTLFKTFSQSKLLQLVPDSQHISMSSAKTIADILSYSQLIDTKASLGNPFTTQPIYIAACAFLKETAEQSATSQEQSRNQSHAASRATSRATSPTPATSSITANLTPRVPGAVASGSSHSTTVTPLTAADRAIARHTLLATAASQHYQLCYKALESLETYWAGSKYILTVLDQKFKGVGDPLLYTAEEGESSLERPNPKAEEAFRGAPGWRGKSLGTGFPVLQGSWLGSAGIAGGAAGTSGKVANERGQGGGEGGHDFNTAIGWTLTGTLNSPSTNLAWHFPSTHQQQHHQQAQNSMDSMIHDFEFSPSMPTSTLSPSAARTVAPNAHVRSSSNGSASHPGPPLRTFSHDVLTNTGLDYPATAATMGSMSQNQNQTQHGQQEHDQRHLASTSPFDLNGFTIPNFGAGMAGAVGAAGEGSIDGTGEGIEMQRFGDMLIESQDVDTSLLGLDTLPWFEVFSGDIGLDAFDPDVQDRVDNEG